MKWLLLGLCVLSLAGNAVLLRTELQAKPALKQGLSFPTKVPEAVKPAAVTPVPPEVWAFLQDGNAQGLELLRQAGFSEALVHAVVRAQVHVQYHEKEQALLPDPRSLNYWRKEIDSVYRPSSYVALLDIHRDKARHLERLLGAGQSEETSLGADPRTAFLPSEKAARLRKMTEEYDAMAADIRGGNANALLPSEREKLSYLDKEKRSDLEQLLTPEELNEYDLRNSGTSHVLRSLLSAFQPNEDEFRAIFSALQKRDSVPSYSFEAGAFLLPGELTGRGKVQAEFEAELKTTLGEKRYADYQRAKDSDFQALYEIGTRLGLPAENAVEAYNLKQTFEKRLAEAVSAQAKGSSRNTRNSPAAVLDQAKNAFTKLLGPAGFEAFRASSSFFRYAPLEANASSSGMKR